MMHEPEHHESSDFDSLDSSAPTKKDDSLASLEAKLSAEQDARKEERFVWILIVTIMFDCLALGGMSNSAAPIAIVTLELILLVVLAKRLGIDDVVVLIDRVLNRLEKKS